MGMILRLLRNIHVVTIKVNYPAYVETNGARYSAVAGSRPDEVNDVYQFT
jgi:hypothetical protein